MNIKTANILINAGYTNVFVKDPPDTISDYILISSSGGLSVGTEQAGYSRPSIQILVADKDYTQMKTTCDNIKKYLLQLSCKDIQDSISDGDIQGYDLSSDVLELGQDKQLRNINSMNFEVHYNLF